MTQTLLKGIGGYLPEKILTNQDLESMLDTSDEWIRTRTGITQRHIAADDQAVSHLAAEAAKDALNNAGVAAADVDMIILATSTPDETVPAAAVRVQHAIGAHKASAFDMNAACSGFVFALSVAHGMVQSGQARNILVIGAEVYSRLVDWKDRQTCVLFGDGAGAVLLQASDEDSDVSSGIQYIKTYSNGEQADILKTTGGVSTTGTSGVLAMEGREVFRHGVGNMVASVESGLKSMGWSASDVDFLVPHQANMRMLDKIGDTLGLDKSQIIATVDKHANTSAASIPLALYEARKAKKLTESKKLVLTALGAGLTWGCCIIVL